MIFIKKRNTIAINSIFFMRRIFTIILSIFSLVELEAQSAEKRELLAKRISGDIQIDGILNDSQWEDVQAADNFTQFQFNWSIPSAFRTEMKVVYDNTAIYVGAIMYDTAPDSIEKSLTARDEFGIADFIGIIIDPYQEGLNGLEFFVTASGVQGEAKSYPQGGGSSEDFAWDAVWVSEVTITENGWVAELKIPYSAIRFPNEKEQTWGINFVREVKRNRDKSAWNPIDPEIQGFINQSGILKGINDIEAPLRLSVSPYVSAYYDVYSDFENDITSHSTSFNGGADLKVGLNDAFTLDMTLIPDFGQVQSDNQILNLTPFETYFVEQRQFFTEGTELFNKGDLFYSRRVGSTPYNYYGVESMIDTASEIISNPSQSHLLNAIKVTGRTAKGLGIGIFNAIEGETYAIVRDSANHEFSLLTGPRTNYNVMAFDQSLKNNSFISFVNTNVLRDDEYYDANVSGLSFQFNDEKNIWGIKGGGAASQKFFPEAESSELGFKHYLFAGKMGGKKQFQAGYEYTDGTYDPNDLGFLQINNLVNFNLNTSYHEYEPFWHFNEYNFYLETNYTRLVDPSVFHNYNIYGETYAGFKNYLFAGLWFDMEPITTYDYFEPRVFGRFYTYPVNYNFGGWLSTNYSKKFAIDVNSNFRIFDEEGRYRLNIDLSPRYRVNDKILIIASAGRFFWPNDIGWVNFSADSIIFGRRDNLTMETFLQVNYTPNVKMSFSLRGRHYWSYAEYKEFYNLGDDGYLEPTSYNTFNAKGNSTDDVNFNAFNVDLVYTWFFAPGSELNIVWKNSIYQYGSLLPENYFSDLGTVFDSPQSNNFSIKVLYYLDYLYLKKKG
jgi:hypothetical protein